MKKPQRKTTSFQGLKLYQFKEMKRSINRKIFKTNSLGRDGTQVLNKTIKKDFDILKRDLDIPKTY